MADQNYVEILVKARDEAKPDLDELRLKLDELDKKVADARVKVTDAGDAAKLDRMAAKLDDLNRKVASPRIRLAGALRAEAEIHAIEASMDNLNRKGDEVAAKGGIAGWLNGTGSIAGAGGMGGPAGIAAIAAAVALLAGQIAAILGPLAAAGLGLGAFGALAIPTLDKVKNAWSGVTTAQKNYQAAVALQKQDPTAANAKASELALDKLKIAWQNMNPVTRDIVKGVQGIGAEFSGLAQRIAPEVLRIFRDLLPGVRQLVGDMGPFAAAIGPVLDKLAKSFSQFTMSAGFKDFLNQMLKLSGPAIATIGEGIGKIAIAIGKFLEASAKGGGLRDLARDFSIVAAVIRTLGPALVSMAATSVARIGEIIQGIRDLIQWSKNLYHWWIDAWHFMTREMNGAQANISGQIRILISIIQMAGSFIARVFGSDVPHWISVAVQWFGSLPGKIKGALGNLGTLLLGAGAALIHGLIAGIESMVPSLSSVISGIGGIVSRVWKFVTGSHSPSRVFYEHGRDLIRGLVLGIDSMGPQAAAAMRGIGAAGLPGGGRSGGYGARLEVVLRVEGTGARLVKEIFPDLKAEIRTIGGAGPNAVQNALGYVRVTA